MWSHGLILSVVGVSLGLAQQAPLGRELAAVADKGAQQSASLHAETLVELAPTPMLDEEGRQRLDPEGKPMWNAPVRQQRDKKGHPRFDATGKAVMQTPEELGFDERGKKLHVKKEKTLKAVQVTISHGTLTLDGMIGKAGLNYVIPDLKYIYFQAPWMGTVVVSNVMFPGAQQQAGAFDQHTLTVKADDHVVQLYSEKLLLGKRPAPAYVRVDRAFTLPSPMPVMGFGTTVKAPYAWPGSCEVAAVKGAPPVPLVLRPTMMLAPCPAGQMREARGATGAAGACVAISVAAK